MFLRENNIFLFRKKFVAIFLIFSAIFNISLADTYTPEAGAVARFFEYPLRVGAGFNNSDFLLTGFRKNKYLGEVAGIKNISWDSDWPAVVPPYGFDGAPITNFLVSITAYYRAPQSGVFNISIKADDFAAVYLGIDAATDVGSMHYYIFGSDEFAASISGSTPLGLKAATKETYMVEGWYYPIEIIYVNYMERGVLSFEIIQPDGTVDTQIGEHLYAMPDREVPTYVYSELALTTLYETFTRSVVSGLSTPTTVSTSVYTDWIEGWSADVWVFNYVDAPMSTTAPTTLANTSLSMTSSYTTVVTGSIESSTTADVSVPITSSYTTVVTGSIDYSTTTGVSVPITSTYTTMVTGNFGSSDSEVFFNVGVGVEVKY